MNAVVFLRLFKVFSYLDKKILPSFLIVFVMMLLIGTLEVLGLGLIVPLVKVIQDPAIIEKSKTMFSVFQLLGIDFSAKSGTIFIFTVFVLVFYLKNILLGFFLYINQKIFAAKQLELAEKLFSFYVSSSYRFYLRTNSSHMQANLISQMNELFGGYISPLIIFLSEALIVVGVTLLLMFYNPYITLGALAFFALGGSLIYFYGRNKNMALGEERQRFTVRIGKTTMECLHAAKEIFINNRQKFFVNVFRKDYFGYLDSNRKYNILAMIPRMLLECLAVTGLFLVFLFLSAQNLSGEEIIATISLFAASLFKLLPSLSKILISLNQLKFNSVAIGKILDDFEVLRQGEFVGLPAGGAEYEGDISFKNVSFSYVPGKLALDNVSMLIKSGSVVGIVGESGSGKSTMVDILMGLLLADSGDITVGNQSIKNDLKAWRDRVGYSPQNTFIMDDTLESNILFGATEVDPARMLEVIGEAQLTSVQEWLLKNTDSCLGERGIRLSGGQKQRIGIARALYKNPGYLILDESTSALDNITEKKIMDNIFEVKSKKTVIIVAHRLSTIKDCDCIFVFNNGKIEASGTYDYLYENSQLFKELTLKSKRDEEKVSP